MKRRAKPLVWLFPLFASVLVYFFVRILDLRPAAEMGKAPEPAARPSAPLTPSPKKIVEATGPKVAIIIDDIGYNLEAVETAYGLGRPLTLAILPDASQAGEAAKLASSCGLEIMLHLPFESAEGKTGRARSRERFRRE